MSKRIDYSGQRFGMLRVIQELPRKVQAESPRTWSRWLAVCDCGEEKPINGDELGRTLSCGCARSFPYCFQPSREVFLTYKYNAKVRGIGFQLLEEKVTDLIHGSCHYCGFALPILRPDLQKFACNGIDRINNTQGYVEGNVVTCCKICNHAKAALSETDFLDWAARLAQYQREKQTSKFTTENHQAMVAGCLGD